MTETAEAAAGLTCFFCGYDLRGRTAEDVCPECGNGVKRSMVSQRLDWADPRWLRRVRWGVAVAGGEYFAPPAALGVASVVPAWSGTDALALITVLTMGLCAVVGAWMVSAREPGRRAGKFVWAVRLVGVVSLAIYVMFGMIATMNVRPTRVYENAIVVGVVSGFLRAAGEAVLVWRVLRRRPLGRMVWPNWVALALVEAMWCVVMVGVTSNVLDRAYVVTMVFLPAGCLAAMGLAGWGWWTLRVAPRGREIEGVP